MEPSSSMEDSKDADAMMESSSIAHSPKEADGRMESSFDIDHTPKDADVKMEPSPIMEHSSHDADVRLKSSSSIAHTPKEADTRMESSSSLDHISKDADVTITSSSTIDHTPKETDARMPSSSNIDHSPKEAEKIMKSSSSIDQAPKDADVDDDVMWADLPTVLLENIYSMLTMRQRFNCSLVCSNWNDVLLAPSLWRTLEVGQETFRIRRPNRYNSRGYEDRLNGHRVKMCLRRIGHHIRRLRLRPISDYYYLGQFLSVVAGFIEYFEEEDDYPLQSLRAFDFTFACEVRDADGLRVIGTGGKLLEELKCLLGNLRDLTEVTCNQLLLESIEAVGLLDMLVNTCGHSLTRLEILNSTKTRYPLFYAGMLPRLRTLVITPLQLTPEVLLMVARHDDFRDLVIVQDPHSGPAEGISSHVWWDVKLTAPQLRVTLECRRLAESELPIQENAPVHRVIYRSAISRITLPSVLRLIDEYRLSLRVYAHLGLPRRHGHRAFRERCDSDLVLLVRECVNLQTLVVRERVSTTTLLIVAKESPSLRTLHVRRNAVLLRHDWQTTSEDWDDAFRNMLKRTCKSYDLVEREISRILGYTWTMMSDAAFKRLDI